MTVARDGGSTAPPGGRRAGPAAAQIVALSAAGYVALGAVGMAIAPGHVHVCPVFPAAGLALALALRFGWRALAGILAGALALNVGLM